MRCKCGAGISCERIPAGGHLHGKISKLLEYNIGAIAKGATVEVRSTIVVGILSAFLHCQHSLAHNKRRAGDKNPGQDGV